MGNEGNNVIWEGEGCVAGEAGEAGGGRERQEETGEVG